MKIRESQVLKKLRAGENVNCIKLNVCDGQVAEIAAMSGFDCIWLDREHVVQDWSDIKTQIWAAKAHDTDVMVRVSRGSYSELIKPFEMDAAGIMVPHIMSLEDAKNVIHMTRFHPIGRRPVDGGGSDGGYGIVDLNDYLTQSNDQRFIVLQIEDPEPLDDLEAIADLQGYDMLFFGPGDFSHGIGAPGQWDHPKLLETRELIAKVARKYGKYAGTVGSLANLKDLINTGYHFVNLGADVVGINNYFRDLVEGFRKI